ncbi:ANTAR domain-containing protein [Streptomyces chrestomyceticus]|uniref:ANTAR domain-containing protein n=1 Tax=Streptomyces chrestomyceticus TaxID=68185 RepID=UPI0033ED27C1
MLRRLSGYRHTAPALSHREIADALGLCAALAVSLLHAVSPSALEAGSAPRWLPHDLCYVPVHQAAGVLSAQLRIPCADALARLRTHAFAAERPLRALARDLVEGTLALSREPGPP